jgi:phage terminase small subunit
MALTPKQRDFCRFYVENQNAQQSALQAGYTEQYAKSKSGALLKNEEVVAEIQRLRKRVNERAEKSATDVVNEYARIAFTDRTSFLKPDPHFPGSLIYKAPEELDDDQKALVEKVTAQWHSRTRVIDGEKVVVDRMEYNYVLLDKANALQQMGRHFGIFDDKLKLIQSQSNPFKNATPEQLAQLKRSFVGIMTGEVVDGEYTEKTPHLLPNGQGRRRARK